MNNKNSSSPLSGQFTHSAGAESAEARNPVLAKIKEILLSTDPDRWYRAGQPLNLESVYPKPLETWEQVFTLEISSGTLTLRRSLPIECTFTRGGYSITPKGAERFTIELRVKGWNPRELIDPYHRSATVTEKKYETLAEGQYARELYSHVLTRYEDHTRAKQEDLNALAANLLESMTYGRRETPAEVWQHTVSETARSVYIATIDGINIEISKILNQDLESFHAVFSREKLQVKISATRAVQDLFLQVEEKVRLSQLELLSKVLESAA